MADTRIPHTNCDAVLDIEDIHGLYRGTVPCPLHGECALTYLERSSYRVKNRKACAYEQKSNGSERKESS